ncbi:MAG: AI-2E family transporter [Candidatus Cohnella colombiensis]|uniref:AI-2E family transporter n=1 Tax=Candidatus Cohnella colombiensis TaxID=3121368 RepID=A0AA95JBR4_9BACL|nr:MAG: AI-2E family transporter [Cohnella sp.]
MITLYQKYWRTAFDLFMIFLTVWLVMYVFSYLYNLATPVFLSLIIFWIIEPLAKLLNRIGIRKSIASAISVLLFTLLLLAIFAILGYIFTQQITQLVYNLPQYQEMLQDKITGITDDLKNQINSMPPDVAEKLNGTVAFVTDLGTKWAVNFLNWLIAFFTSISSFVINFSIAIILAYFLSIEIDTWKKIGKDRMPKTFKIAFDFLRNNVFRGIGAYIKAQGILISITFLIIFITLLALNVNNAFSIALLAGIFDILPLLGVNTLFIPWVIYLFFTGDTNLAWWLTGLLLVVMIARQLLEPRITGQTIGVSAFTMLVFMVVSLSIFGIAGLILAPILMILMKALYDQGYFHKWIRFPKDEFNVAPLAPDNPIPPEDGAAS